MFARLYNALQMTSQPTARATVILDGLRTPFLKAGTGFLQLESHELARTVLAGLLERSGVPADRIGQVVLGSVLQNPRTSNVARDAALAAGYSAATPAHTVTQACISASRAVADAALQLGREGGYAVAGGVELLSDVPPVFGKKMRARLFAAQSARTPLQLLGHLRGLKPAELLPRAPAIAEFTSGETMGANADRLAARFGISREEQDRYALRAHELAARAEDSGRLAREVMPVSLPPDFTLFTADNTIRRDTGMEALARLKPAFVKPFGTVTAGNSSPLTDGAAALLLARADTAEGDGLPARALLRDWLFTAGDPGADLLLGPAFAIPQLLGRNGLTWNDIDVIELHEAFAGQVLAVLAALGSPAFGRERLGLPGAWADPQLDNINLWGGSISLGHPFGATGARLLSTAMNRLEAEDGRFALVAACAAGGQASAMLLERSAS